MKRLKDLSELWNWLPAFRAVGETEHLPSAGKFLLVSPAALSRSVALLERRLGKALFDRRDQRLHLNESGRALLGALRQAMELLEQGLDLARSDLPTRPLRVCSGSQTGTNVVISAIDVLQRGDPDFTVEVSHPPFGVSLRQQLLQGEVDLVVSESPTPRSGLTVELLGEFSVSVYCGAGHPLFKRRKLTVEELSDHPFVGPPASDGTPHDDWPVHLPRTVSIRVPHIYGAMRVCAQGRLLAILPDRMVDTTPGSLKGVLRRLPVDVIRSTRLHATRRAGAQPVGEDLVSVLKSLAR